MYRAISPRLNYLQPVVIDLRQNRLLVEEFNRAVDTAIDEGWATVAAPLEFSEPVVSRVMDGVQRYIANADDRPAVEVERADAALAAQHLSAGTATEVYIYLMDIAAGGGRNRARECGVR